MLTTPHELINIRDNICLITGATAGIGKETAIALARLGARIVLTTRDKQRGEEVCREIIAQTGNTAIDAMMCDFNSLASVMTFASAFKARYNKLNILINNAGVMEMKRKVSRDGIELTFAVNHLAPFLLTKLLLDTMKATVASGETMRIINVASEAHQRGTINFEDIEGKKDYNGWKAYSQSKLANILFTRKLAHVLAGTGITVNALHPGVVATKIFDVIPPIMRQVAKLFMLTPQKGAENSIYLATAANITTTTGEYFVKKKIAQPSSQARDMELAERLWNVSEQYIITTA